MVSEKWDDLVKAGLGLKKPGYNFEVLVLLRNMQLKPGFISDDLDNIIIGNCDYYIACSQECFEKLFSTNLKMYEIDKKKCYEMLKPAVIPSQLEEHIISVEIINSFELD